MGKQGSPGSPRPDEDHQFRSVLESGDPSSLLGRRSLSAGGGDKKWIIPPPHGILKNCDSSAKFSSCKGFVYVGKRQIWFPKHVRSFIYTFSLMAFLFLLDSFMFSFLDSVMILHTTSSPKRQISSSLEAARMAYVVNEGNAPVRMYNRLLGLASNALEEKKELARDSLDLWEEMFPHGSRWKPCVDMSTSKDIKEQKESNGFIFVSANGGLNQQRVAVCNAVAVTALLNATLVIPKFLFSNVWKDPSQFGDIYQEQHFINILKNEVNIVKELPPHLKSLDLEAIGSLVTDADLLKEAKLGLYIDRVLPLLKRNGVVHLLGFGNRLGFDPLPIESQRLRCKCNFHSLKFVPKIQQLGTLLVRRIRKHNTARNALDKKLLGKFISNTTSQEEVGVPSKYIALHLRFEIDMIAYSMCEFGGGENERKELQAYRESHFPLLNQRLKKSNYIPSSKELRKLGKCPLTPEEAALVLAGIGFKRRTLIYLAGSRIYGGQSRMNPLTSLYPNMVTKEDLLTPTELAPFRNFSSQMAALDFMACATADVFAITDSGSQLSSLVSGLRKYYGGGNAPILKPDKRKLAEILLKNGTISWHDFEDRVRKMTIDNGRERTRFFGESIYREPRCHECMCKKK